MNETLKTIYGRRAVRRYKDKPVDRNLVEQILDAARMAPSAFNKQTWKFYVLTKKEQITEFSKEVEAKIIDNFPHLKERKKSMGIEDVLFYDAPVVVLITAPRDDKWASLNVGMCAQTMMLAARSMGLDSCPIGMAAFGEETKFWSRLWVSKSEQMAIAIALGYGDEKPEAKERIKDNAFFLD